MRQGKFGMAKYLGSRGPYFESDTAAHLQFWQEDLARNDRMLAEAKAARDVRVIALARKQRREIVTELGRHGKVEVAA